VYKYVIYIVLGGIFFVYEPQPISTLSSVVMSGGIIKSKQGIENKKYPRKNCPVCKGKGWYMSGDNIKKIDCTYCEPDGGKESSSVILEVK
jgi:hypothetical protein